MSVETIAKAGKLPSAEAIAAAEMLQYQEGAVVSRTILKEGAGSVTLFAFDEGQGLTEHTSPFDALVYLLDGEAEIRVAGKPIEAKKGDLIWMPANQPHALKATTRFKMMLTMLRA
ncbi:MAG TPA: cupin domain-containing protein [Terriglobales bacterium]|nr:cupin domain-containing protein [Terriglobales bacterium]